MLVSGPMLHRRSAMRWWTAAHPAADVCRRLVSSWSATLPSRDWRSRVAGNGGQAHACAAPSAHAFVVSSFGPCRTLPAASDASVVLSAENVVRLQGIAIEA